MSELRERLSILVTTSPIRSNPSTMMIEELFESFRLCPGLAECPKIVVCDGCNVGDKEKYREGKVTAEQANKYGEFCDALEKLAADVWTRTTIVRMPERIGFAHAAYAGLQHVETELVTVIQHDLFFVREVDFVPLCEALTQHSERVNYITLPGPKHLNLQQDVMSKYGIRCDFTTEFGPRLLPVIYWFDKTHVCRTSFYKSFVYGGGSGVKIPRGQFTEHELGVAMRADIVANGFSQAHPKYGCFQFDDGKGLPMIEHMNGRRFMTAEQRAANGWPADRPVKIERLRPRGGCELPPAKPRDASAEAEDGEDGEARRRERQKFVVTVQGGLANRLRTILGFHMAAKYSERELLVFWKVAPPCPGSFSEVLQPIEGVEFIDEEAASALIRQAGAHRSGGMAGEGKRRAGGEEREEEGGEAGVEEGGCRNAEGEGAEGGVEDKEVVAFTGQATVKTILRRFLHTKGAREGAGQRGVGRLADATLKVDVGKAGTQRIGQLYRLVRAQPHIEAAVDRFAEQHALGRCVGLHVRRTDHEHMARSSSRFTSDEDFVARMRKEREGDAAVRFFLATDNAATQRKFLAMPEFRGALFVFDAVPDAPSTLRHTDLERAVVDVLLLSRCRYIHGSACSSYSELAWNLKTAREMGCPVTAEDSAAS